MTSAQTVLLRPTISARQIVLYIKSKFEGGERICPLICGKFDESEENRGEIKTCCSVIAVAPAPLRSYLVYKIG